jgi:2-hydroxy-6-oxonona-2,4-dienedioate hydrolase
MIVSRILIRALLILLVTTLLASIVAGLAFDRWKKGRMRELQAASIKVETKLGPIEYQLSAEEGHVVLILHGAPGGYDQSMLWGRGLVRNGFQILGVSRPGYLRTPLASGILPEQQADLMAALLQELGLEKVSVIAVGEAAPSALQLALRHQDRLLALILVSPVLRVPGTRQDPLPIPGQVMMDEITGDVGAWLLWRQTIHDLREALARIIGLTQNFDDGMQRYDEITAAYQDINRRDWILDFARTLTPLSPRDSGTRNDIVQTRVPPRIDPAKISIPVLIMQGEDSRLLPPDTGQELASMLPNGNFLPIKGCGDLPPASLSEEVWREALIHFLRDVKP